MSKNTSGSGGTVAPDGTDGTGEFSDAGTTVQRERFDPDDGSDVAIVTIVEAIGGATGRPPTEITPLHASVDSSALGALATSRDGVYVTFVHEGCHVTASSDGQVAVVRPES